ncbi:MAG: hypothetical protein HGA31_05540 [Candidatus Moranbacteria bacterium]|nr:hypothetical protein [Candidatus Moranbacteria bacterium]
MDIRRIIGVEEFKRFPDVLPIGTFKVFTVSTLSGNHTIVFGNDDSLYFIVIPIDWILPIPEPLTEIEIASTFGGITVKPLARAGIQQPCFLFVSQAKIRIYERQEYGPDTYTALVSNRAHEVVVAFEKDGKRFLILRTEADDYLLREEHTTVCGNDATWESVVSDPDGFVFELRYTTDYPQELLYREPVEEEIH